MKLDCNCVREVLLFVEEHQQVVTNDDGDIESNELYLEEISEGLPKYSKAAIYYTLAKLSDGGYIDITTQWTGDGLAFCCVNYITYQGHEFLEKIRPETLWEQTTSIAGKVGTYSLQAIAKIAEGVATAAINKLISSS